MLLRLDLGDLAIEALGVPPRAFLYASFPRFEALAWPVHSPRIAAGQVLVHDRRPAPLSARCVSRKTSVPRIRYTVRSALQLRSGPIRTCRTSYAPLSRRLRRGRKSL